ncbi:MAG: hypothetical protein GC160_09975 [Acidobacteria bacterium]|nr:hypothetical protein [Acidobacteriota bacterium]
MRVAWTTAAGALARVAVCWAAGITGAAAAGPASPALEELIEQALERNPSIQEAFARYRAAAQKAPQVTGLPDPQIGLTQYARSPETRVGPQSTMVSISQRFPWLSKLRTQGQAAEKEAAAKAAMFEAQRDEVARRVKVAYWDLAYVDRAARITSEDLEVLRHFETLAEARYSQGVGLQQAAIKLQAEITRGMNRLQTLRRRRVDLEASLNALCDREARTPIPPAELPVPAPLSLDLERLYAAAQERRPEMAAALLRIETEEKRIDAARKQAYPDVTVGAGYTLVRQRQDEAGRAMPPPSNGKDIYSVTVGVNLPIFRRKYNAAVYEATENFLASKQGYRGLWNQVQADVRSIAFDLETMQSQLKLFEDALLPQAEQALRSGESSYANGGVGVLDLLDSQRTLLEIRLGLAQLRSDYWKSTAELERATGAPLAELEGVQR